MSIHFLPQRPEKPSALKSLLDSDAIGEALDTYQQQQALNRENATLKSLGIDVGGVSSPDIRKKLLESGLKKRENNELLKLLDNGANFTTSGKETRDDETFEERTEEEDDAILKLDDRFIATIALQNPSFGTQIRLLKQDAAARKAQRNKVTLNTLSNEKFSNAYQAILNSDDESFNKVISDPATPFSVKKLLVDAKNQMETRKSVRASENRRTREEINKAYKQAIANEQANLKTARYDDKAAIKERIKQLQTQQKRDLKHLSKNPEGYGDLEIWKTTAGKFIPQGEEEEAEVEAPQAKS